MEKNDIPQLAPLWPPLTWQLITRVASTVLQLIKPLLDRFDWLSNA